MTNLDGSDAGNSDPHHPRPHPLEVPHAVLLRGTVDPIEPHPDGLAARMALSAHAAQQHAPRRMAAEPGQVPGRAAGREPDHEADIGEVGNELLEPALLEDEADAVHPDPVEP